MRSRRRTTKWNLFFHYSAFALAIVSGIVLVPLYLRSISLNLYGAWLATGNILAWITIVDPGLSWVLQQRSGVAYGKRDSEQLNALLTGGIMLSAAFSLLLIIIGLVTSRYLGAWLNLTNIEAIGTIKQAFIIEVVGTSLMFFSFGVTSFNQGLQSSLGIGIVYITATGAGIALTALLLYEGVGLVALPLGTVVRGLGLTLGNAAYLFWRYRTEKMRYRFSIRGVSALVKLSSFTFLSRGASVIATNMDAYAITRYLGPAVAPILILTRKAPDVSRMIIERPSAAVMPAVSHLVGTGELARGREVLLQMLQFILRLLGLFSAGFIVFNDDFVRLWVGKEIFAGYTVNVVIVLALVVTALTTVLSNLCFSLGNIRGNSIVGFFQGLLSMSLIILGTKYWGILGVAVAPLLAMLCVSAWYYPRTFARLVKLERADVITLTREALASVASAMIAMSAFIWITTKTWPILILAVTAFCTVYLVALSLMSKTFLSDVSGVLRSNKWVLKVFPKREHM